MNDVRKDVSDNGTNTKEEIMDGIDQLSDMLEIAKDLGMMVHKKSKADEEVVRIETERHKERKRGEFLLKIMTTLG